MLVITRADIGGAQVHVRQILAGLGESFRFTLVTGEEDYLTREARDLGIEVLVVAELVRPIRPLRDLRATRALVRLIRQRRPDLVHAHSFKAGVVARIAARLVGTPALFTAHGWAFTPGAPLLQRGIGLLMESVLCRLCSGVITVSQHDERLARRWHVGSTRRRYLVANAADDVASPAWNEERSPQLVTVGRLTPVKHQVMLLEVLALLPGDVTLTIIGEGPERTRLEGSITRLGLAGRVSMPGEVREIGPSLAGPAIFLLSSDYEGLPVSVLEALAAGLPVVATSVGGVAEAVEDGETGYVVARRDVGAFVSRVNHLLANPVTLRRLGDAGRRRYEARYTSRRFLAETIQVYRNLLGN